jgi:hypothetical protein
MGGWPPIVSPVLEAAKGKGDYEVEKLPRNVREGTLSKMGRFVASMKQQGHAGAQRLAKRADSELLAVVARASSKTTSSMSSSGAVDGGRGGSETVKATKAEAAAEAAEAAAAAAAGRSKLHATGVGYGYKAPVSMLLVPFFHQIYHKEGFKFLQVGGAAQ